MLSKKLNIPLHLLFWLAFFSLTYNLGGGGKFYIRKFTSSSASQQIIEVLNEPSFIYVAIIDTVSKAILVYLCLFFLKPKLSYNKLNRNFILNLLALFLGTLIVSYGTEYFISESFYDYEYFKKSNRYLVIAGVFHVGLLSLTLGFGFWTNWYRAERQREKLKEESLLYELKMLKSQINPHFLFNTLNNIFALSRKSEDTRLSESIAQLSNLMRYMLNDNSLEFVPLEKEIKHITDFISLQKLRFSSKNNEYLSFEIKGSTEGYMIAPLILLPFIENAFKFSPSIANAFKIKIEINIANEALELDVFNTVNNLNEETRSSGFGLKTVKRRLSLLYPQGHHLLIEEKKEYFKVKLKIELSQQNL